MDQEKIGKFIAECRKENGYTQASLAEKLGITDRAISKWENGKSMPDASIMLELCELLKINVNELLTGEHIIMDNNYKEVAEKNLVEMKTQEEKAKEKVILVVIIFVIILAIMLLFAWFAGRIIGEDLGEFIYNTSH
jgi:transcriptional regulator with XRE-family HTH domain